MMKDSGMDQYTILGRIGEGAHGIVFKAKHIEVNAIKWGVSLLMSTQLLFSHYRLNIHLLTMTFRQYVVRLCDMAPGFFFYIPLLVFISYVLWLFIKVTIVLVFTIKIFVEWRGGCFEEGTAAEAWRWNP